MLDNGRNQGHAVGSSHHLPSLKSGWLGRWTNEVPITRPWNTSRFRHLVIEIGDNRLSRFCFAHLQDCIVMWSLIMGFTMWPRTSFTTKAALTTLHYTNNVPLRLPRLRGQNILSRHTTSISNKCGFWVVFRPLSGGEIFGHDRSLRIRVVSQVQLVGYVCVAIFSVLFRSFLRYMLQ